MTKTLSALAIAALMLGGCSDMTRQQQRALSGGAIGTAGGAAIAAIAGGPIWAGALAGAGAGAAIGAVTK
jgi:osmotically inducible lipoprotein OsmB